MFDEDFLIERAKAGDQRAFTGLFKRYYQKLERWIDLKIDSKPDAQDLALESLFKAFSALKDFNQKSKFETWLYKIAENTINDFQRRKKCRIELVPVDFGIKNSDVKYKPLFSSGTGGFPLKEPENGYSLYDQKSQALHVKEEVSPENRLDDEAMGFKIKRALNKLPQREKAAFILSYCYGMEEREIAALRAWPNHGGQFARSAVLDVKEVYQDIRRGKEKLKKRWLRGSEI